MAAFATSYIKTEASQVTRNADAASMTGTNFSSWFNNAAGTVYVEVVPNTPTTNTTGQILWDINDATANNRTRAIRTASTGVATYSSTTNGIDYVSSIGAGTVLAQGATSKVSAVFQFNDFAVAANAGTVAPDTSAPVPVTTRLTIGASSTSTTLLNGTIKKLAYYPQRLTDAQLQALTA